MRTVWWRWVRGVGAAAAVLLLIAAVWFAAAEVDLAALMRMSWAQAVLLGLLVMVNLAVTGGLFWMVTRSFDAVPPVGLARMTQLIALSALLNYLPLIRPGLLGRTAYLRMRHQLPVRQSLVILAIVMGLAVMVCCGALIALLPLGAGVRSGLAMIAIAGVSAAMPRLARAVVRRPVVWAWAWVPVRVLDLLAAAARLWLAFQVIEQPIAFDDAMVMGAASLLIKLVGITPSGLGLSEWAVAALSGLLAPITTAQGMAAALIDRGVEVLVVTAAGVFAAWRLREQERGTVVANDVPV